MEGGKQQSSCKKFPRSCGLPFCLHPDGQSSATRPPSAPGTQLEIRGSCPSSAPRPPALVSDLRGGSLPSFASVWNAPPCRPLAPKLAPTHLHALAGPATALLVLVSGGRLLCSSRTCALSGALVRCAW